MSCFRIDNHVTAFIDRHLAVFGTVGRNQDPHFLPPHQPIVAWW
jgi:hypothetical protein